MQTELRHIIRRYIITIIFFQCISVGIGRTQEFNSVHQNPDSLFIVARTEAFKGRYDDCRQKCFQVLNHYPGYIDFRILAARTLAWEQNFDSARVLLQPLILNEPPVNEALLLLADIDKWSGNITEAGAQADTSLQHLPDSFMLQNKNQFVDTLNNDTNYFPNHLAPDSNAIGMTYYFQYFKLPYVAYRHMLSFEYRKTMPYLPLTMRLNVGEFVLSNESLGTNFHYQFEIDIYPQLKNKSYFYFNYGVGQRTFFPLQRLGAEYFRPVRNNFVLSGGFRAMYWDSTMVFITGSIAKYLGNYWFCLRPFITIYGGNKSNAYIFEGRRYLKPVNSFVFMKLILGDSPDQPITLVETYGNFRNYRTSIGFNYKIKRWNIIFSSGWQYEEFLIDQFRNRFEMSVGLMYAF